MRAIFLCRKQGVRWPAGPHNERASSCPVASHRRKFKVPTLIEGMPPNSRPPFSATADPDERADSGGALLICGLSAGAGSRGFHGQRAHIMLHQVRALGPLIEENFRGPTLIKVKSVKSDFNRRAAPDFEAAFLRNC